MRKSVPRGSRASVPGRASRSSTEETVTRPTAYDEQFVHQIPELLPNVAVHHQHWRESYFFDIHDPSGVGDVVFFTFAPYPARAHLASLQMGPIGGEPVIGFLDRPAGDDPLTTA